MKIYPAFNIANSQKGVSLIELMVALVVGLILILGVTQLFINNQKTYQFQQGQAGNQDNSRFTLMLLEQELGKAGYRSLPSVDPSFAYPADTASVSGCNFDAGVSVTGLAGSPTTGICLRYQIRNALDTNCLGAAPGGTITNHYKNSHAVVVEKIQLNATTKTLTCTVGSTSTELTSGIADLRFEYGIGATKTVSTFTVAPTPTATSPVGSVRYSALLQSEDIHSLTDSTSAPVLNNWKSRYTDTTVTDTSKIYQIAQSTVMLRNVMP